VAMPPHAKLTFFYFLICQNLLSGNRLIAASKEDIDYTKIELLLALIFYLFKATLACYSYKKETIQIR
jgi:hypothetical protein